MPLPYGSVSGPRWDSAALVGGGPSLAGFDLEQLRGRIAVVAVNDALLRLDWASAVVSLDTTWIQHRREELAHFRGEKYLIPSDEVREAYSDVTYLRRDRSDGLSFDPTRVCLGGTSGYAALNVAVLKGAREIFLFGYDYQAERGRLHWFPDYPWQNRHNYWGGWANKYWGAKTILEDHCIQIWNVGKWDQGRFSSRITAFPWIRFEDALHKIETGKRLWNEESFSVR